MLTLGGVAFDGYSPPSSFPLGGQQAMAIHKLPGGSRVIDTLGPDEANITWSGFFFSNDAESKALSIDALRATGAPLPLVVDDQFRIVIIKDFSYRFRRRPVWIEYEIVCVVIQNPALGSLSATPATVDALVQSDLQAATAVVTGGPATAGLGGVANTGLPSPGLGGVVPTTPLPIPGL
jgi:hypothetical protein